MPLYVRAGAIIPFGPVKQYTEEKVNAPLTLRIYPGADGQFELYEDDGRTFNFRRGEWMGILMRWTDKSRRLSLALSKGSKFSGQRVFEVMVVGDTKTRSISFSGRPVKVEL
jgi:alpha-glucosidase (family GH31 glycosyl hydrolase)